MKTRSSGGIMKTFPTLICALLRSVLIGALACSCQCALAIDVAADPHGTEVGMHPAEPQAPAAWALAQRFRAPGKADGPARIPAEQRVGMHMVVRLAMVDLVSHPNSGDVNLTIRSKLLKGPIAKAPVAVAITWRF
jgi:hypothetical protein